MKPNQPSSDPSLQRVFEDGGRSRVELASLLEISQALNHSLELPDILNRLLLVIMGRLMISRGLVLLKDPATGQLKVAFSRGIRKSTLPAPLTNSAFPEHFFEQPAEGRPSHLPGALARLMEQFHLVGGLPIRHHNQTLGLVLLGPRLNGEGFGETEKRFLYSLSSLAGMSIHNASQLARLHELNRQLDVRIQQLRTLFELTQALSSTLHADQVVKTLTYALMGQFLVNRYAVVLNQADNPSLARCHGLEEAALQPILNTTLALCRNGQPVPVQALEDTRLRKHLSRAGVEVILPLFHKERCTGILLLGPRANGQPYLESDLEFLATLATQAAISLENARLFHESLEKQRMEEELHVARNIQQQLLPETIPQPPGYAIAGRNIPTHQVGGDYFDVISVDDCRLALVVADVSGKGVPAALLMANLQAALRLLVREPLSLKDMASRINRLIFQNTVPEQFATAFLAMLDVTTHRLSYVNAGHNYPILRRPDGRLHFLSSTGTILGLLPEYEFQEASLFLNPGDLLVIYTDGINEAVDPSNREFGEDRLQAVIQRQAHLPPPLLLEAILQATRRFADHMPQADDMTLLVLRRETSE